MKELEELITNPKKLSKLVLNHLINRLVGLTIKLKWLSRCQLLKELYWLRASLFILQRPTSNIILIFRKRILRSRSTVNQRIEQTHVIVIRSSQSTGGNFPLTHFPSLLSAQFNLSAWFSGWLEQDIQIEKISIEAKLGGWTDKQGHLQPPPPPPQPSHVNVIVALLTDRSYESEQGPVRRK